MRIFWNKSLKKLPQRGCRPRVITSAYYSKFVEFVSSAKFVLLPSEQYNCSKCSVFASSAAFALIFHFKL